MELKEHKTYFPNGQLKVHSFLKDGKFHGEYKSYYPDGHLAKHNFYKDSGIHGEHRSYGYKNGQLHEHLFYVNQYLTNIPFLPDKPTKLPPKSNRSRIQTLEL